jgi:hypothetical protein
MTAPPGALSPPCPTEGVPGRGLYRLRWIARLWSVASVTLVLLFIVGERSLPATPAEWLHFVFFPFGVCVGLCLGWRREGLGGLIAVASLVTFYLVTFLTSGTFPRGLAWLVFAAPGPLYLISWAGSHRGRAAVP